MICAENIHFFYSLAGGEFVPGLRDVTLSLKTGEMMALLGVNGSGKSTLVKIMAGMLLPQQGEIKLYDYKTGGEQPPSLLRRQVGFVLSHPGEQLLASTVMDEVAFGLETLGLEAADMPPRIHQALAWVGLEGKSRQSPQNLSAGEQQRLLIACALARKPSYLLLDEPTAFLDPAEQRECLRLLQSLTANGLGVLFTTQILEQVSSCQRAIVLAFGRIAWEGPPMDLLSDVERLSNLGLCVPELVALGARLHQEGFYLSLPTVDVNSLLETLCPVA